MLSNIDIQIHSCPPHKARSCWLPLIRLASFGVPTYPTPRLACSDVADLFEQTSNHVLLELPAFSIPVTVRAPSPTVDPRGSVSTAAATRRNLVTSSTRRAIRTAVMTGLGSNNPQGSATVNGGFNVASSLAVGLIALFTVCVLVAVCYSIYYHQAKLKLRLAKLEMERSMRLDPEAQQQDTGVEPEAAVPEIIPTEVTIGLSASTSNPAISMVPPVELSHLKSIEEEPKSPTPEETKMKAPVLENKSLGRFVDYRPLRQTFDTPSIQGQMFAPRPTRT